MENSQEQIIPRDALVYKLLSYGEALDIPLTEEQACLVHEHVRLMLQWNQRLNLTRITQPDEVLVKHVLDSLFPFRWLPREGCALDVGTGAGFPGIPLKILNPGIKMLLLEAQRKKVSFLRVVLSKLALKEIQALQGRWEDLHRLGEKHGEGPFALITMRALRLEGDHLLGFGKLLVPGGILAWWAGPGARPKALRDFPPISSETEKMVLESTHSYSLPGTLQPRQFFTWRRVA